MVAIAGKLALNDRTRSWLPERLATSVSNFMPPKDCFLFVAVWEGDRRKAQSLSAIGGNDEAATLRPGMLFDNTQDYLFWAYAARRDAYPPAELERADGAELMRRVQSMIRGWHPDLLRMVGESDPSTVAPVFVRSMAPVEPWPTSNVTLIGDAIHNMTPLAGIGANTALRDARLLAQKLVAVNRGDVDLLPSIHEYEEGMLDYGFKAVKLSLRNAHQATSSGRLGRAAFRTMLRLMNAVPPMKRQMARAIGS